MSKFYNDHKQKEDARVRHSARRDKLASYFFDVSKLSLGGVVFTSAFAWFNDKDNFEYAIMALVGMFMVIIFAVIANKLLK